MAIIDRKSQGKIEIDLSGPGGNVFALIGNANRYARQLGLDGKSISADMMSGDYENAITVFDKHFGDYVDLVR